MREEETNIPRYESWALLNEGIGHSAYNKENEKMEENIDDEGQINYALVFSRSLLLLHVRRD